MCKCFSSWSKDPKPDISVVPFWEGKYVIEGDSNIHNYGNNTKSFFNALTFNIGQGGDIPQGVIDQFSDVSARHHQQPIEKAYIQIGGNLWTWYPLNVFDMNFGVYTEGVKEIIKLYKKILNPQDIVIAGLPYVDPSLKVSDMIIDDYLPVKIQKQMSKISLTELFGIANEKIKPICNEEGVKYLDIWVILKLLWKTHGKKYWWDSVHYALDAQKIIAHEVLSLWEV